MRLGNVALVLAAAFHAQAANLVEDHHSRSASPVPIVRPGAAASALSDEPPAGLTHDDWSQIQRAVDTSEYRAIRVTRRGEAPALQAPNRKQAYRTTFRRDRIEIAPQAPAGPGWRLGLSVTGYGYAGDVRPVEPTEPQLEEERVEYRRGPVTEWYVNRPEGLEQGFELKEPRPRRDEPVVVTIAVQGDLDVAARGDSASFAKRAGQTVIRYAGLKAWDAEGRPLQSHLEALDRDVRLVVEASAARFPITVDPTFVHEAQLFGNSPHDIFGFSVSVSGDTLVIAAPGFSTPGGQNVGAAYVFVRSGTTWTQQQTLLASDGAELDSFGWSVSVSGDTAVVGANLDDTPAGETGSAYVFVRSGTTWTQQQKLVPSDGESGDEFGRSVSVSGDTVVVGAFADFTAGGLTGSAYVFERSGTIWTQQQKLLASDGAPDDRFGYSVAASGDTVVVGAHGDDTTGSLSGSAYVFVRSGTTWTEQQKLLASDGATEDGFGWSVAASGETVVIGAPFDDLPIGRRVGSAYVFVRTGTTWTQEQKLLASDGAALDDFGEPVSVSGDTVVVGSPGAETPAGEEVGAAYVFVRSGTTWSEQQKLLAPDGESFDFFGQSVSVSVDTVVVAAPLDDVVIGTDTGSVHVFREQPNQADLDVIKTDGQTTAVPGAQLTYTIVAGNSGPSNAAGVTITDTFPPAFVGVTWTCAAAGGASCTASGSGSLNDTANLPVGGTATYTVTGTVSAGATGTLSNTATVAPATGDTDPNPANNSATDTDTLTPETDLWLTKTDSADPVSPGDPLTYSLTMTNLGPSDATAVTVVDTLPAGVTFVSSIPGPPTCNLAGVTVSCALGTVGSGNNTAVSINVTVDASASGILVNTATASGNETDPDPKNNFASAATAVGRTEGELAHGTDAVYDLAAQPGPVADADVFRINQKPHSSYEVVVDATSGDIGAGQGPFVERLAADGSTVLQSSSPIGTGSSRTLRWRNTTSAEVEGETIRVRSAGCGTDCGPDDVYRIRSYETSYSVPRFNNAGTQITVLILQNPTNDAISGEVYFWISSGALVAVEPFTLNPKGTLVLDTTTVPGADGVGGAITVAHDGGYGDLSGKTVAVEPATGFSFDSPLLPRVR